MKKIMLVDVEETFEEKYKREKRNKNIVILLFLLIILGIIIYEAKFAEKGIFNNEDKYEEYDPNYPLNSSSNIEQFSKKETSNIVEGITSNITSNIIITSNVVNSNSNNIISNNNKSNNINKNEKKDAIKPTISKISFSTASNYINVNVSCSDDKTETSKLKIEYSKDGSKYQSSNKFSDLEPGTSYKIYVRVTDEAGNSTTSNSTATTTHSNVVTNVSGNYSNTFKVYQNIESEIIVKYNNKFYLGKLISRDQYTKKFKCTTGSGLSLTLTFQDNSALYNSSKYKYTSSFSDDNMFTEMYGGVFILGTQDKFNNYAYYKNYTINIFSTKDKSNKVTYWMYATDNKIKTLGYSDMNCTTYASTCVAAFRDINDLYSQVYVEFDKSNGNVQTISTYGSTWPFLTEEGFKNLYTTRETALTFKTYVN